MKKEYLENIIKFRTFVLLGRYFDQASLLHVSDTGYIIPTCITSTHSSLGYREQNLQE